MGTRGPIAGQTFTLPHFWTLTIILKIGRCPRHDDVGWARNGSPRVADASRTRNSWTASTSVSSSQSVRPGRVAFKPRAHVVSERRRIGGVDMKKFAVIAASLSAAGLGRGLITQAYRAN